MRFSRAEIVPEIVPGSGPSTEHMLTKCWIVQLDHNFLQHDFCPCASLLEHQSSSVSLLQRLFQTEVCAKSLQLCLILCDAMDSSPPGSSVHRILQVRILEWVVMLSSRGSSWPRDWAHVSYTPCTGRQVLTISATWEALFTSDHSLT